MSLINRQAHRSINENLLAIQNEKVAQNAREGMRKENISFKPVDEELIREYNKQFSSTFKQTDPTTGREFYRKFVPVEEPTLIDETNIDLESEYSPTELQDLRNDIATINNNRNKLRLEIKDISQRIKKIRQDATDGKITEQYKSHLIKQALDKSKQLKQDINKIDIDILHINDTITHNPVVVQENEAKRKIMQQKNKEIVEGYRQVLNTVNLGAFTTQQLPNETNDEYLARLKQNAEIETPQQQIDDMKLITMHDFRTKLKEIIRRPDVIEQVANAIDKFGDVDKKLTLLKTWELFKAKFVKIYGVNNSRLGADDILTFIYLYLNDEIDEVTTEQELIKSEFKRERGVKLTDKGVADSKALSISDHVLEITRNDTGKKLYLACLKTKEKLNNRTRDHYVLLYSFTGKQGSFKQFFDTSKPSDRKIKSTEEISYETGINQADFLSMFNSLNPSKIAEYMISNGIIPISISDVSSEAYQTIRGTSGTQYGYGLHPEKIPETAHFGKMIILLKKLYYHNILSVKHHNGISVAGFPNVKVGEKFVSIIMNLMEGINPTHSDINSLNIGEKMVYDRLIHLADLHKKVVHNSDKTIQELKKKLKLLEGEIGIGNNNPQLKKDIYYVVHSLKNLGVLDHKQMKEYLSQY